MFRRFPRLLCTIKKSPHHEQLQKQQQQDFATDLFTNAFIRACSDTSRLDQLENNTSHQNNKNNNEGTMPMMMTDISKNEAALFDVERSKLVNMIRERQWENALSFLLMTTQKNTDESTSTSSSAFKMTIPTAAASSESLQQSRRAVDVARLTDGLENLIRRIFRHEERYDDNRSAGVSYKRNALRSLGIVKDQQRAEVTRLFCEKKVISEDSWKDALSFLERRKNQQSRTIRNNNHNNNNNNHSSRNSKFDSTASSSSSDRLHPSACQTALTNLLHRAKQEKQARYRANFSGNNNYKNNNSVPPAMMWKRAMELLSSLKFGEIHSAHVSACLGILYEQDQYDRAIELASRVLIEKSNQQSKTNSSTSSSSSNPPSLFSSSSLQPNSAFMMTLAILVRDTQNEMLAERMLLFSTLQNNTVSTSLLFPFAAWAACDVLRRKGKPEVAAKWYMENIHQHQEEKNNNINQSYEKFTSHLKLTSCIAKCVMLTSSETDNHQQSGRKELAMDIMKNCKNVEGYERVAAQILGMK